MSGTINFIDSVIRNLKPQNKRIIYWCEGCPGFGIRVTPNGKKVFVYKYNKGEKRVWVSIGNYPEWSIRQARKKYDELFEAVRDYGRDPVAEEREAKRLENQQLTVREFMEVYIEAGRLKGKVDVFREQKAIELDVLPIIGDKKLPDVTGADIDDIQRRILERAKARNKDNSRYARRNGRGAVFHTLAYTRQLFNLALSKNMISANPVSEVENLGSISVRERVLSFKEIWQFWHNIENVGLPFVTAKLFKFMLVTMQRGAEVRHMKYSAYKPDERMWQMTMHDTKNRVMHRVPLSKYAEQIIEDVKPYTSASPFVFGATRAVVAPETPNPELKPLTDTALPQALRRKREILEIEDFTPHDLRRSGATWISAVGLPPLYAELLLNHKDKKSDTARRVYIQYSYDNEKRRAMDVWEFILLKIIESPTIDDVPSLDEMRKMIHASELL